MFLKCLDFKIVLKTMLCWGKGYGFVSTQNKKLWIHSRLTEIRFDWGKPPENPGCRHREITPKLQGIWHIFYLLKYKTKKSSLAACVQRTVHTCVNADMYATFESSCVFRTRRPDTSENGWFGLSSLTECLCCSFPWHGWGPPLRSTRTLAV